MLMAMALDDYRWLMMMIADDDSDDNYGSSCIENDEAAVLSWWPFGSAYGQWRVKPSRNNDPDKTLTTVKELLVEISPHVIRFMRSEITHIIEEIYGKDYGRGEGGRMEERSPAAHVITQLNFRVCV